MKNLRRNRLAGVVLISTIALAASSCTGAGGGQGNASGCDVPQQNIDSTALSGPVEGKITFQTTNLKKDFSGFFQPLINRFQQQNPGTEVTWIDDPGDQDFDSRMLAQARACDLPDVVNLTGGTIRSLDAAGQLIDFSVKSPGVQAPFVPSIWDSIATRGTVHPALPWYWGPAVQTYNSDLMSQAGLDPTAPPKTVLEQLAQATRAAEQSNGKIAAMNANPAWNYFGDWYNMGVQFMDQKQGSFTFSSDPKALAYLEAYAKAYAAGAMPKDSLAASADPSQAFAAGQVIWGSRNASFLRFVKQNAAALYPKVGVAPIPKDPGTATLFDGQYVAVPTTSKNARTAAAFATFLTNDENQLGWAKDPNVVVFPTTSKALQDPFFSAPSGDDPMGKARQIAAADAQNAAASPVQPYYTGAVDQAVLKQLQLAIAGSKPAAQALKDAENAANQILKQSSPNP